MATTNTRRNLLRRAAHLVIVDDGEYRWVGSKIEVYRWLDEHGVDRLKYDSRSNEFNVARMDDTYQALCDATTCITATHGSAGDYAGDPYELIDAITDRGAPVLNVR